MAEKKISDLFSEYETRRARERQDALDAQAAQDATDRMGLSCLLERVVPAFQRLALELNAEGHSATVTEPEASAVDPVVRLDFRFGKAPPYSESKLTVTALGSTFDMRHTLRTPYGDRDLSVSPEYLGGVEYERIDDAWLQRLGIVFVEAVLKSS